MKLFKGLLLGSAAALTSVVGAQAADLPVYKAAPIEYVRVCDAFGAGFFYIPGTDTCLRVGGLVLAETRSFNPQYSIGSSGGSTFWGNGVAPTNKGGVGLLPATGATYGYIPSTGSYANPRSRDAYSFGALGRVELDARTKSDWGTVRTFLRVDFITAPAATPRPARSTASAAPSSTRRPDRPFSAIRRSSTRPSSNSPA